MSMEAAWLTMIALPIVMAIIGIIWWFRSIW